MRVTLHDGRAAASGSGDTQQLSQHQSPNNTTSPSVKMDGFDASAHYTQAPEGLSSFFFFLPPALTEI